MYEEISLCQNKMNPLNNWVEKGLGSIVVSERQTDDGSLLRHGEQPLSNYIIHNQTGFKDTCLLSDYPDMTSCQIKSTELHDFPAFGWYKTVCTNPHKSSNIDKAGKGASFCHPAIGNISHVFVINQGAISDVYVVPHLSWVINFVKFIIKIFIILYLFLGWVL